MLDLSSGLFGCAFAAFRSRMVVAILFCLTMLWSWQGIVVAQPIAPQLSGGLVSQVDLENGLALAKSKTCLGCHQVDAKRVGPAFQQIAQRHADTPGSLDYLVGAIRQGGRGRWGAVPMPAQPQVSESESRLLAQWILSLKP